MKLEKNYNFPFISILCFELRLIICSHKSFKSQEDAKWQECDTFLFFLMKRCKNKDQAFKESRRCKDKEERYKYKDETY